MLLLVADYPMLSITVWYNKDSMVNILSLVAARKLCCVAIDTAQEAVMHVQLSANNITTCIGIPKGLYFHDTDLPNHCTHKLSNRVSS